MYRKRILAYTEIIDYKVYMNCKYRFRVISGSHILHLPVKSVIVGIKVHYIFDISFKSFHCLFLLSLSYGCIIKQVNREFMPNRKKKQTNLAKKGEILLSYYETQVDDRHILFEFHCKDTGLTIIWMELCFVWKSWKRKDFPILPKEWTSGRTYGIASSVDVIWMTRSDKGKWRESGYVWKF